MTLTVKIKKEDCKMALVSVRHDHKKYTIAMLIGVALTFSSYIFAVLNNEISLYWFSQSVLLLIVTAGTVLSQRLILDELDVAYSTTNFMSFLLEDLGNKIEKLDTVLETAANSGGNTSMLKSTELDVSAS